MRDKPKALWEHDWTAGDVGRPQEPEKLEPVVVEQDPVTETDAEYFERRWDEDAMHKAEHPECYCQDCGNMFGLQNPQRSGGPVCWRCCP